MEKQKPNYIYLLQEREFIKTNESVYKVGKTKQENLTRFYQYPKGSLLLQQSVCSNCDLMEGNIIKIFKTKYIHRKDIGNEYFEGNWNDMKEDIDNCLNTFAKNVINYRRPTVPNYTVPNYTGTKYTGTKYACEKCNFDTINNYDYNKHLLTKKHINNSETVSNFECLICKKKYFSYQGLWKHKKKCYY